MRRLTITLLLALAVVPTAALAARTAPGDGSFELRAVNGLVIITGKGVFWGQMDQGSIRVTDPDPADGVQPLVSGAEHTRLVSDNTTVYWGSNLHFRLTGGKFKVRFKGAGIDLTAIGVGSADMTGDATAFDQGDYSLDGGKWTAVPLIEKVVPFGAQTTAPPTSP